VRASSVSVTCERLLIGLALAGSLALRLSFFPFVSGDMRGDMTPWSEFIEREGAWQVLGQEFSNYPPLYLCLLTLATWLPLPRLFAIKLVYVAFDYVLAFYVGRIVASVPRPAAMPGDQEGSAGGARLPPSRITVLQRVARQQPRPTGKDGLWARPTRQIGFWPAALTTLFLPTVLMNSALWGQCDAMYASGLAACVYYLVGNRAGAAMVAYGLAFSLKPQAVFLAPLILVLVWQRRFSSLLLYMPAAVYVLLALPACVAGRSFLDLVLLYAHQRILPFPALTLGATNLYQWLPGAPFQPFFKAGLALAAVSGVAFMIALARRFPAGLSSSVLVRTALLALVLMPFVLPAMHERYFLAADALAVAYAFTVRSGWVVTALIQFASAFTYLPYLFNVELVPRTVLAAVMGVALGRLFWDVFAAPHPAPVSRGHLLLLSDRSGAGRRGFREGQVCPQKDADSRRWLGVWFVLPLLRALRVLRVKAPSPALAFPARTGGAKTQRPPSRGVPDRVGGGERGKHSAGEGEGRG